MNLENELKVLLIEGLKVEDTKPEDIENDSPIFGDGIGLDSLDAVELVVLLKKHYNVDFKDMDKAKKAFQSIQTLADHIREERKQN